MKTKILKFLKIFRNIVYWLCGCLNKHSKPE